ncbi:hypothetical protein BZA77DRAFT_322163 [Pyronema omphalodes]|nr:hypothetical protein BZA77DRAFT_322163 [Pyronema omphalodes]
MITHPSSVIKQKLTGAVVSQIAELNTPYDSNGAEAEFVAAHAKKEAAIESDDTAGVQDAARTIEELEIKMRNMKMGVIMGRHVNRVRVVPKLRRERPEKEEFLIRDENGMILRDENGMEQVDYLTWLGQYLVYVTQDFTSQYIEDWAEDPEPLCIDRMRCHIERIFIASSSWQRWFLHIRDVYRWKDPNETFRWLALYIFLWSTSHVVAFVWGYLIFSTTKRYIFPQTIEDYREKVLRQRVRSLDALRFDQVLSSGSKGLISYFESEIGPQIQLQLGDIASLLEVANNFIEWQAPRATFFTLVFLSSCFIITLFGDMQLCMQLMFFVFGLIFFFSFPISSHYPKYRYLVSPFKWALWGVPNNAEWAFAELRFEAQNRRERMIAEHIDHDPDQWETDWEDHSDVDSFISATEFGVSPLKEDEEIMRFRCRCGGHAGRLYISPARMRYETIRGKVLWKTDWRELTEVKKTKKKGIEKLVGGLSLGLELVFVPENGRDVIVKLDELGKRRDEAFCTILGFSGLKWQWCS